MNSRSGLWRTRGRAPSWLGAFCVLVLCAMSSGGTYSETTDGPCRDAECGPHGPPPPSKTSCPQLNGLTIPAREIGLPTTGAIVT